MRRIICAICAVLVLCAGAGCGRKAEEVPADFSFALTWSVFGISSYDSATGELVKSSDENIETEYQLDVKSYPDEYDPNPDVGCDPAETLILTVRTAEGEKTITARDTAYAETSKDTKGDLFLKTCRAIQRLLTDTEAWRAMPEGKLRYA